MPRNDGFLVADIATTKHYDAKFKKLWRTVAPDEAAMNAAGMLYEAVQLVSWQRGERVSAEEAAPYWMTDVDASMGSLRSVGLLDDTNCIPEKAWESWFGTARDRREQRRTAGRAGGQASAEQRSSGGQAGLNPTVRPTVLPTDTPAPRIRVSAAPADEEPFVTLTDDEKEARKQRERDEFNARTMARLGVRP